jgi:cupin 2 domain-containing protein
MTAPANLLAGLPRHLPSEVFTALLEGPAVCIERIVSHGHSLAEGFGYD